jgi:polysaccharide pyruvyl transferase WcaK-like protein
MKGALHAVTGGYDDSHYSSIYFHHHGEEVEAKQRAYLEAIAAAFRRYAADRDVFPITVGMERLDRKACEDLALLVGGAPVFVSDDHDMYSMVSVIRQSSMMVSSRYHAIVTSMPGGVPSIGVTMDERIRNLMGDRGQPRLALEVDDPELEDRLYDELVYVGSHADEVRSGIEKCVVMNLERMGRMGMALVDHVREHHPEFPFRAGLGGQGDPWDHLPTLPRAVQAIVKRQEHASKSGRGNGQGA